MFFSLLKVKILLTAPPPVKVLLPVLLLLLVLQSITGQQFTSFKKLKIQLINGTESDSKNFKFESNKDVFKNAHIFSIKNSVE
jgi:hypothetical protein